MPTLLDALDQIVATDPARPLLTWYRADDRVELSGATVANWVAKTAGLLRDEMDVQPGDHVHVSMGPHWLAAVLPLGIWRVGAVVNGPQAPCLLTDSTSVESSPGEAVLLPSDPFAVRSPAVAAGWVDFASAVRIHPDVFTGLTPDAQDLATSAGTHNDLLLSARESGRALGAAPGDRLLLRVDAEARTAPEIRRAFATAVASQASLVILVGDHGSLPAGEAISAEFGAQ